MAKPKFSFEAVDPPSGWVLTFKVENGARSSTWRIGYKITNAALAKIFTEVAGELDPQPVPAKPQTAPLKPPQSPEVLEPEELTEEASKAALDAKASKVTKTGQTWYSNMDQDTELPLYTIGHGK